MVKKKILILMSSVAGGHSSVAEAIRQSFESFGHEVVLFDAFPFLKRSYSIISRHLLDLYGFFYWASNGDRMSDIISKLGNEMAAKKIATGVLREIPDFVVSDYPFLTQIPKKILLQRGHVPLGAVVVDPVSAHSIWFKGRPDVYFIPTDYIEKMALKAGVPSEKIVFTGYPVREEFYKKEDISSLRKTLRLDEDVFTLMIGGSSEGVGKIKDLCERLSEFGAKYKFKAIVICGKNKALFKKLSDKYYFDNRFKILPFEKYMADYVKASDLIVSKAGPSHLYETVAALKPFLAFSYMPGQEEGNLDLIKREKIGLVEEDLDRVASFIKKCIIKPETLKVYKPFIKKLRDEHIDAGEKIVKYVEKYLSASE